jgi:RNA-directed DNA polymerase
MADLVETLTVVGGGGEGAWLALREAMRFKTRRGGVLVEDATGRAAMLLGERDLPDLRGRLVAWVDLADRRRPVALFQIARSGHAQALWARVLRDIRKVSGAKVSDGALDWAAQAAYALSGDGAVGLGALLRCVGSGESRRWFLDTGNEPGGLSQLQEMLAWALCYPAVYGISEGSNRGRLASALEKPAVVWLEAPMEHFEPKEHSLVAILLEAAIEDALRTMAADEPRWDEAMRGLTVLHVYPPAHVAAPIRRWHEIHGGKVRHVGVHRLEPERAPAPAVLDWIRGSEFLWVAGPAREIQSTCHGKWLTAAEAARLRDLKPGELWIRSNRSGRSMATRVREPAGAALTACLLRGQSAKKRKPAAVEQAAEAARRMAIPAGAEADLYAKLCETATLRLGWLRVREGGERARGVDGVSVAGFAGRADAELEALSASLRAGKYRPRPLRRVQIPKADGGVRNLGIACVRDRVVQAACLTLLEPVFEAGFSRFSYAFRPGRNAHQAVAMAKSMMAAGRNWAVISDIRKCFDEIDHEILIALLAKRIADEEMLELIRQWLTVDVVEFRDLLPTELGVPQGESISPLLANVYLDSMDKHFERCGLAFVRYADDLVILTESEESARQALGRMADYLREALRLELKPAKTSYVPVAEGFDFLGFRLSGGGTVVKESKTAEMLEYMRANMKEFAECFGSLESAGRVLSRMNSTVRGWRNYYRLPGEAALEEQLGRLDAAIEEMAAAELPESVRSNPAWLCRERLSMGERSTSRAGSTAPRKAGVEPGPGYPGEDTPREREEAAVVVRCEPSGSGRAAADPGEQEEEAGCGLPGGSSLEVGGRLYVMTHGAFLAAEGHDLVLKKSRQEVYRRPMQELSLVYLQGYGISVSVDAQVKLAEHDIPVVFAPPLGNPVAVMQAVQNSASQLRRLQAVRRDDEELVRTGMAMIAAKIVNQAAVLQYFAKYRGRTEPEKAAGLMEGARQIRELAASVLTSDPGQAGIRATLLGMEGHAAALYWKGVASLAPAASGFGGRVTFSAEDPVNQCLNYVYGILYGEVWRAVVRAGLDPYFGLVHGSARDQGSLVFDVIEEFRAPFADRVVIGMLGRGFRPDVGSRRLLRTAAKQQLARAFLARWRRPVQYRSKAIAPERLLGQQARSLAEVFRGEGTYHAYRMKW